MSCMDLRAGKAIMSLRLDKAHSRAESQALRYQAGDQKPGWFTQQGYWLLCQLGRRLVTWGEQLEQHNVPQARPAEGGLAGH